MLKYSIITVRQSTDVPFFINTDQGQEYEKLAVEARNALPTSEDQENALVAFNRIESPDGLTLTTNYVFMSSVGRDALMADLDARLIAKDMPLMQGVRSTYNEANNQTTTFEIQII